MPSKSLSIKSKVRISITIMPSLDNMLKEASRNSGESKSYLVERAISAYLKSKLEKDIKILSKIDFDDLPSENDWLEIQSKF